MQLIASLTSPYARKIRVMLLEKGLPFELLPENPADPASHITDYNPLGKVPALVADDGTVWFDSPVIADVVESLDVSPRLIPAARAEALQVRQIEALADGILDAGVLVLLEGRRPAELQSEAWRARHWGKVERGLAALDARVSGPWLVGDSLSLADVAVAACWGWLQFRFPEAGWAARHPRLAAWVAPVLARPSFASTVPQA